MRLVNMACEPNYLVTIEGHALTVIEADGIETEVGFIVAIISSPKQPNAFVHSLTL